MLEEECIFDEVIEGELEITRKGGLVLDELLEFSKRADNVDDKKPTALRSS
jgi:hypothetical protein